AGKHDGPVVVVELARKKERAGEAVVFRTVVAVMLVGRNRVPPEAVVLPHVVGQAVVMTEQQRLAGAAGCQLRRNGAVEGPDGVAVLRRPLRMEAQRNPVRR